MPENRSYAGPHDAASLLVSADTYTTVLRNDLSDDEARKLGYTTDADTDPSEGLVFAHRTITVSDELAAQMPTSVYPRVGGATDADNIVDDPASNPVTSLAVREGIELESVAEVHERQKAERLEALDTDLAEFARKIADRDTRIAELKSTLDAGKVGDGDDERAFTDDERATFEADIAAYENANAQDAADRDRLKAHRDELAGQGE